MITEDQILEVLKQVRYPGFSRDIVSFQLIRKIEINGEAVLLTLQLATDNPDIETQIRKDTEAVLQKIPGIQTVLFKIQKSQTVQSPMISQSSIEGIQHVIAVASGKGGVGKSTVAANLAMALKNENFKVGLCDCDLYGPSIGMMFGTRERPTATEEGFIEPILSRDMKLMSMSFLLQDNEAAVLRGPLVTRYTQQFLRNVEWGELDFLILDLPPGTGDIQLTIAQTVALSGAIIVTTPQEVALADVRKAMSMFSKVNVPIAGIIENMSYFKCPSDGNIYHIFGEGGGKLEAERLGVPLLAQIPIDISTCQSGDRGKLIFEVQPDGDVSNAFKMAAQSLLCQLQVKV